MKSVRVDLQERSYPIEIGAGARAQLMPWFQENAANRQIVVVADATVAELHLNALLESLPKQTAALTFPAGESAKSLSSVESLADQLADRRVERGAVIVAFGGGVAGDLAGFLAAVWLRGIQFVQVPTTLLAAVDASVGGKTGVNLKAGKNLVGSFHQPGAVIVDTDFLQTLSDRDYAAGLAESVKHGAIRDADFLVWHEHHAADLRGREADLVADLIARNCQIKAAVVSADEREGGLRAVLNHGHTIGHAIERVLGYELRHGECVGLGMLAENEIARRRKWLTDDEARRVHDLLAALALPTRLPRAVAEAEITAAIRVDKKVAGGLPHFVLLEGLGVARRGVADVTAEELTEALAVIAPT